MRDHGGLASSVDEPGAPDAALVARIRGEFLEMPGMRLTSIQAARICGVPRVVAHAVLQTLVVVRLLRQLDDGSYARVE